MELNKYIDHTLLRADATIEDIKRLCREAKTHKFMSVCIHPSFIQIAQSILAETGVKICTVVGFPLGAQTTETKIFETENAINMGADEIDMVINITYLKNNSLDYVTNEIVKIRKVCQNKILKVIIETSALTDDEKRKACGCIIAAKADYVKTSTGFGKFGATIEDIYLLKKCVGHQVDIKASGGIKDYKTAIEMINAGAKRIGTSAGVEIIKSI